MPLFVNKLYSKVAKRTVWSSEEMLALVTGLLKYQKKVWIKIKKDPEFENILKNRSNIQLKDKFRVFFRGF